LVDAEAVAKSRLMCCVLFTQPSVPHDADTPFQIEAALNPVSPDPPGAISDCPAY
jgi:hypothetical protein